MSTPDEKAAAFDPDAPPIPPVGNVGDLTEAHVGSTIEALGLVGILTAVRRHGADDSMVQITMQEDGRPLPTMFSQPAHVWCALVEGPEVQLTDVVDMNDFYAKARELDRVSKQIRANDAATEELKKLKSKLSDELLGTFTQVGESSLNFGDRRAYIHTTLVPEFEEKPDGTKYTLRDLVDIFKQLGREDQVTAETVNYQTLQGVLREIREGVIPFPSQLAAMVKIGERPEVRVGVGRKTKR